jgi:hypothetical protein
LALSTPPSSPTSFLAALSAAMEIRSSAAGTATDGVVRENGIQHAFPRQRWEQLFTDWRRLSPHTRNSDRSQFVCELREQRSAGNQGNRI